jgi:hypothetical protein
MLPLQERASSSPGTTNNTVACVLMTRTKRKEVKKGKENVTQTDIQDDSIVPVGL